MDPEERLLTDLPRHEVPPGASKEIWEAFYHYVTLNLKLFIKNVRRYRQFRLTEDEPKAVFRYNKENGSLAVADGDFGVEIMIQMVKTAVKIMRSKAAQLIEEAEALERPIADLEQEKP